MKHKYLAFHPVGSNKTSMSYETYTTTKYVIVFSDAEVLNM